MGGVGVALGWPWGELGWDEYSFLFGTVYLHWGVVLNSPVRLL